MVLLCTNIAYAEVLTNVSACRTFSTANSQYNLNQSVSINGASCFVITATNVTLNCNGYSITGNYASGKYGVYSNKSGTSILNCNVNRMYYGINFGTGATGGYIFNSSSSYDVTDADYQIYVEDDVTIINSTGTSMDGLPFRVGNGNYVSGCSGASSGFTNGWNGVEFGNDNTIISTSGSCMIGYGIFGGDNNTVNFSSGYVDLAKGFVIGSNNVLNNISGSCGAMGQDAVIIGNGNNITGSSASGCASGITVGSNNRVVQTYIDAFYVAITVGSSNNLFYWNNIIDTGATDYYVVDSNGSNNYNSTEGNFWANVLDNTVSIYGSDNSSRFPGYYIGKSGSGYPYNNTNAQGKLLGNVIDYAPLTPFVEIIPNYHLMVSAIPANGGNVSSSAFNLSYGATRNISAIPNTGYVFTSWNSSSNELCPVACYNCSNTTVSVYSTCDVTALFSKTYDLTLFAFPTYGGTVSGSAFNLAYGTTQNISAIPNTGYVFASWYSPSNELCPVACSNCSDTSVSVYSDCNVTALFSDNSTQPGSCVCSSLSTPNSVCMLTQNLTSIGTCFTVAAANVTIDCNDFSITGNNASNTYGIYSNQFNTTITNCNISNFQTAIYFDSANNGGVYNTISSTTYDDGNGIYITGFGAGWPHSPTHNTFINSTGTSINGYGIYIAGSSNSFTNFTGTSTDGSGIYIESNFNTLTNSTGISTNGNGITLSYYVSTANTITNSFGISDGGNGIYLESGGNTLTNSIFSSNTGDGIRINAAGSIITNSTATSNSGMGIRSWQVNSRSATITNTIASSDTNYGIYFGCSSGNTLTNITSTSNSSDGIHIEASFGNEITNSISTSNTGVAISLDINSDSNKIRNTILVSGNKTGTLLKIESGPNGYPPCGTDFISSSNTFCLNNFTETTGLYVDDANGNYIPASSFNCTYDGMNQGNIYANVMNGSVEIIGTAPSSIPGFVIGTRGLGYPYNSITSQGKVSESVVDYAPLTQIIVENRPKLTVTKVVINDNGGTSAVSDFPLFVNNQSVTSSQQNEFDSGTYFISETNLPGYSQTISGDCAADGTITLESGQVKSCIITNDDIAPTECTCGVLATPNSVCTLTQNLTSTGTCFTVMAENVTIDCARYDITGSNARDTYGIYSNQFNTTIKNCVISNFDRGIFFEGVNNGTISNIVATATGDPGYAIILENSNYNRLSNFNATSNTGFALIFISSSNNIISNFNATSTNYFALYLFSSPSNILSNFTATSNTNYALSLSSSSNNILSNFTATSNDDALSLYASSSNTISNFTATSIQHNPVNLDSSSSNNISNGKLISGNGVYAHLFLRDSSGNRFYWNNFTSTSSYYVQDLSGGNFYNTTINGSPEGNIWANVMNGGVNITGTDYSVYGNGSELYVGSSGPGYPYNNTNAQGKLLGNVIDYAPLTQYYFNNSTQPESCVCGSLSTPNSVCILTQNLTSTSTCFTVGAANVTIDCQGNSITGGNILNTYGIYTDQFNTTIQNCNINNFATGIYFNGADNGTINATNTSSIRDLANSNGNGIYFYNGANYNQIINSNANSTQGYGIALVASFNNILSNINAKAPARDRYAISLIGSSDNILSNITAIANATNGKAISLASSSHNTISRSTATAAYGNAISIESSSYNNTISSSIATSIDGYAIFISYSSNNTLSNLTATTVARTIYLQSSPYNTLSNLTASATSIDGYAIRLDSNSNHNTLSNLNATSNSYAIWLTTSSNNLLSNLTATSTDNQYGYAIYLYESPNNTLSNLTATTVGGEFNYAVYLRANSNYNTLSNITATATGNSGYAIMLESNSNYNNLSNINATATGYTASYAIRLSGSNNNTLSNFTATTLGNFCNAISLWSSSSNTLSNLTATSRIGSYGSVAIYLEGGSGNTLSNLKATASNNYTIYLLHSDRNILSNLNASATSGIAIYLKTSSYNTLSNLTATTTNDTGKAIVLFESSNYNTAYKNTLVSSNGAGTLLYLADVSYNKFCWNNFTETSGYYVNDLNGGNFYNSSVCNGEGNIYANVMNGNVHITGVNNSLISGLYIGNAGAGYPYQTNTSAGKFVCNFANCADFAPLTNVPQTYLLTVSAFPANGGNVSGSASNLSYGATRNISAISNAGYAFTTWNSSSNVLCPVACPTCSNTSVSIYRDCNVTALFSKTYRLLLSASPSNGGSVTGTGSNIPSGTLRNITATLNPIYWNNVTNTNDVRFMGWRRGSGNCSIMNVSALSTQVNMTSNCSIVAQFNLSNVLTLSTYPYSNLGGNAYGAGIGIPTGTYRNISAVAKPGYKFRVWDRFQTTCNITNRMSANTTVLMNGDCQLQASFANATLTHLNVTITPANAGNVRITPDPYGSPSGPTLGFEYGENPKINATPAFGYTFVNWTRISGDCDVFYVPCSGINCTTNPNSIVGMHFTDCRLEARFRYSTGTAPVSVIKK